MSDRPNDGEPQPDTAKSEDRTESKCTDCGKAQPRPGYTQCMGCCLVDHAEMRAAVCSVCGMYHPRAFGVQVQLDHDAPPPGYFVVFCEEELAYPWVWEAWKEGAPDDAHKHFESYQQACAAAREHHDAIAKPAYDRGFAAGRAAELADVLVMLDGVSDAKWNAVRGGCCGEATSHTLDALCDTLESRAHVRAETTQPSEAHNERMREEGDARTLAACAAYIDERGQGFINASNKPENEHASVRLHKAGSVLREEARRLLAGAASADHVDALAKREAAAEERGRQAECDEAMVAATKAVSGRCLYNAFHAKDPAEVARWEDLADHIGEAGCFQASITQAIDMYDNGIREPLERRIAELAKERDRARAMVTAEQERDFTSAERAAAKKALEDAAASLSRGAVITDCDGPWSVHADAIVVQWLRERAAALQGGTDGE